MEVNNAYFEQVKNFLGGLSEDELLRRISECQTVLDRLAQDKIWQIILKDAKQWVQRLDSVWQDVYDEKQLNNLRVLKTAYKHLVDLPLKYAQDLEFSQKELERRQNTAEQIDKDYDNETKLEEENG